MVQSKTFGSRLFTVANYCLLALLAIISILPILHLLAVSFSDRAATAGGFVTFWPVGFTTISYQKVFTGSAFLTALLISLERTVLGTALMMLVTVLTAYPLSRPAHQFKGRAIFMWLLVVALLFSGGLIPLFLVVRDLKMLNTIWALIIPVALPIWNIILLMNFFRDIPEELEEAAILDGATHWQILWHIFLPLSLAPLATLSLFSAVFHWNAWFDGLIYMTRTEYYPLQTFLRTIIIELDMSKIMNDPSDFAQFSDRSLRAAAIFVTMLPILCVYPFLQRYFVVGIRLGAVKG